MLMSSYPELEMSTRHERPGALYHIEHGASIIHKCQSIVARDHQTLPSGVFVSHGWTASQRCPTKLFGSMTNENETLGNTAGEKVNARIRSMCLSQMDSDSRYI